MYPDSACLLRWDKDPCWSHLQPVTTYAAQCSKHAGSTCRHSRNHFVGNFDKHLE